MNPTHKAEKGYQTDIYNRREAQLSVSLMVRLTNGMEVKILPPPTLSITTVW